MDKKFGNQQATPEQERKMIADELSLLLHDEWRKTRLKPDGSYETRLKKTTDTEWIGAHNGRTEVDIANTFFEDLPSDWQTENQQSSAIAVDKIMDALNIIHDRWLERNFDSAGEPQKTHFSRLPQEEKDKDIEILRKAIDIIEKHVGVSK